MLCRDFWENTDSYTKGNRIHPSHPQITHLSLVLTWEPVSEHAHTGLSFLQLGPHYCYICSWLFSCHLTCLLIQHARKRTFSCEPATVEMCSTSRSQHPSPLAHSGLYRVQAGYLIADSNLTVIVFSPFIARKERAVWGRSIWPRRSQLQTMAGS